MLTILPLLAVLAGPTPAHAAPEAAGRDPRLGRWRLTTAMCSDGAPADPRFAPTGKDGTVVLNVSSLEDFYSVVWSRWRAGAACWNVGVGLLINSRDEEGAAAMAVIPGFAFILDQFIQIAPMAIGLHCPKGVKDPFFGTAKEFVLRPGDNEREFRWLDFTSRFCSPGRNAELTFQKL
jgi:hypothetical protein